MYVCVCVCMYVCVCVCMYVCVCVCTARYTAMCSKPFAGRESKEVWERWSDCVFLTLFILLMSYVTRPRERDREKGVCLFIWNR